MARDCSLVRSTETLNLMKNTAAHVVIDDVTSLPSLFGDLDKNLKLIENAYGVVLTARGNKLQIEGEEEPVAQVEFLIRQLADMLTRGVIVHRDDVHAAIRAFSANPSAGLKDIFQKTILVSNKKRPVAPKNETQRAYVEAIKQHDIVFGIGPAGTGKDLPRHGHCCFRPAAAGSKQDHSRTSGRRGRGKARDSCPAISMKRSIPTFAPCMMRSTT